MLTKLRNAAAAAAGWTRLWLGWRALVWAALLALLALVLDFVPLFDVLGYDFAFAIGLVTAFAAPDLGQGAAAAARRQGRRLSPAATVAVGVGGALAVLVAPLALSLLNALRVRNCDLAAGLVFFLLLPVATAVYGAAAGALVGWGLPRGGRLVAWLLPVVSIAWTLLRLYRDPPVFAFDPFGGYFPGPIYDEALRPPERLWDFRQANLLWIAAAVALASTLAGLRQRLGAGAGRPRRLSLVALALGALVLTMAGTRAWLQRDRLGFHVDHQRLTEVLRRQTRSTHFVVHSDPAADGTASDRRQMLEDLEFRYFQLRRTLGVEPAGPVEVFVFPSADAKKELVGAGATLYAKPWTRQIFIQTDRFPARRLRHELAHVFAGAFGDPVFGIALAWRLPFPRLASGLVEGAAEAADFGDPDGRATVHQEMRAMIAAGLAPPLAQVVGAGFTTLSGARAYTMAGSFSHFLLRSYGAERFRALYRSGGDFAGVYGQDLATLEGAWRRFLETQPLDENERARARERFRRPAIFGKVCARDLAARLGEARGRLYSLPEEAVAMLRQICADDPGEPSYRLDLAEALYTSGDAAALTEAGAIERDPEMTQPLRARAANIVANTHYHAGRLPEARAALERARALATEDGEQRTAFARLRALADERARATLGRVLFGESPTRGVDPGLVVYLVGRFAADFPDEALGPYLLGRQLVTRDPALALGPLEEACPLGGRAPRPVPLPPLFDIECKRMVAEAAFRARDLPRGRLALEALRREATSEAERLRAADGLERLIWMEGPGAADPSR